MPIKLFKKLEEYITLTLSFFIGIVFYPKKRLNLSKIHRIAVIKLDHIGDLILSIPAMACLRGNFPESHITIVVNPSSEPLARLIPYIDEVLCYNARFFDRTGKSKMFDIFSGIRFARDMRMGDYDLIIDLRGSFASLFYAFVGNAEYRLDRGTYLVYRKLSKINPDSEHEAQVNLDILKNAGLKTEYQKLWLNVSQNDIEKANLLLKCQNELDYTIAIHPGGPSPLKRWSPAKYVELINKLQQEYKAKIVFIGGRGEESIVKNIMRSINGQAIDLSGQTNLSQLVAILQKVQLFIGNDSGPMHIASACGTKVIGLFGPTSPERFSPYGDQCIALRMEKDCPPCMRENCKRQNYRCIDKISVEDVINVIKRV